MCLQVPEDLTPLLFQLLTCVLLNQRQVMKMLDPQYEQTKGLLAMNDSVFSVLLPVLDQLTETSATRRDADPVPPVPDVKCEPTSQLSDTSSSSFVVAATPSVAVRNECNDASSAVNLSRKEDLPRLLPSRAPPACPTEKKRPSGAQYRPTGGFIGDFDRNVAAAKEEQKALKNVLLIRGVLNEAVPQGEELQLARSLLAPCSHIARATSASRIGTHRNILRVELDQPSARAVVDFFRINRQLFSSPTMSVIPSRAPSIQLAVRRLHDLREILERRLPHFNAQIVKGRGLLLRGTDHFTAFAAMAPGLVLSNGDVIPSSLLLENPEHPLGTQKNDPLIHSYYKAHDHFVEID
jgi:hypothetical protein